MVSMTLLCELIPVLLRKSYKDTTQNQTNLHVKNIADSCNCRPVAHHFGAELMVTTSVEPV